MSLSLCVRLRRVVGWSALAVLAFAWSGSPVFAQAPNALFSDERTAPVGLAAAPAQGSGNPMVRRSRTAAINLQMLTAPAPARPVSGWAAAAAPTAARSVDLNLFSDVNLVALFDHMEIVPTANGAAWVGKVAGSEDSQVILALADGVLAGVINLPDRMFSVRRQPDGTYLIAEINRAAMPPIDSDPPQPPAASVAANAPVTAPADSGDTFDLLLYYTTTVKNAAGGTAAINALLTATIAQANTVYLSSGIPAKLRLVGAIEMNYTETADMEVDLPALRSNSTVQADRNRLGADFVTLLVNTSNAGSGLGYVMGPSSVNQSFESAAYSVVLYYNFINYIVALAHELGHNMGCLHEPGNNGGDETSGAFLYSRGYTDPINKFFDVMSYGCSGCTQMTQFSSATNTYQGFPSGTATQDAARTINNTRTVTANFRQTVPAVLGAPTSFTASSSGANITLTWSAGSGRPTSYVIEAGTSSGKADIVSFNSGSATSFATGGIANGLYYLRVYATDGSTMSPASDEAVLQVGACTSAPTAPTSMNVSVTGSTFVIAWIPGVLAGGRVTADRATNYLIDAGSSAGSSNLASGVDITTGVVAVPGGRHQGGNQNQLSWSFSGLGAGSYYLRVRAKNACGTSGASNEVVATVR
jgi:hypothetical protein